MSRKNLDILLSEHIVFVKLKFENWHCYEQFIYNFTFILQVYSLYFNFLLYKFFTRFYQKILLFKKIFEHYTVRNARKFTKNTFMHFYILKVSEKFTSVTKTLNYSYYKFQYFQKDIYRIFNTL